jgi:hypothetical protein
LIVDRMSFQPLQIIFLLFNLEKIRKIGQKSQHCCVTIVLK